MRKRLKPCMWFQPIEVLTGIPRSQAYGLKQVVFISRVSMLNMNPLMHRCSQAVIPSLLLT